MFRTRLFGIIILVLSLVFAGGGYYFYRNVYSQAQEPDGEPTIITAQAGRGDLVISASGSGTLIPASESVVGFRNGGVLAELLVDVGEEVEAGQLLARLDDADAQDEVRQAELSLRQAELDLIELGEEADPADLAGARASLASAEAELNALMSPPADQDLLAARENLRSAQETRNGLLALPDPDEVEVARADLTLAEMALRSAQTAYDQVAWRADIGTRQEAADLWQATTDYERAQAEYEEAREGATADELADARAQIALAQAQLDALLEDPDPDEILAAEAKVTEAQAQLDDLLAGAAASDLEAAELNLTQAQISLKSAQRALEDTQLVAPSRGTVIAVDAQLGDSVGTTGIITLANLEEPQIQFWVEEADMASVSPGNRVEIVFEALPDDTYSGEIVSVDPALVDVDGTPAVQAYASVDLSAQPASLLSGMNAEVEVVAGEARKAVLVPLQALRELAAGQDGQAQYAVFVVLPNAELEMRVVQVGLKDFVNAQILSGLEAGEVVSLGSGETSSSAPSSEDSQQPPPGPGGGFMRFLGGQ
jgi:RND family efflux transporter MFP subunit